MKINRHKRFNEILPYTYLITHIETGLKYHGVRYGNITLNLTPENDNYRGSSSNETIKRIYENPEEFNFELRWTFDSIDDALQYEANVNGKIILRKTRSFANANAWGNKVGAPAIDPSLAVERKNKIGKDGLTTHQRSSRKAAETMRNEVGESGLTRAQVAGRKANDTMSVIGEDGLTTHQRNGKKLKAINRKIGEDGLSNYERNAINGSKTKCAIGEDGLTTHERSALRSRESNLKVDENGLNGYQRGSIKTQAKLNKVGSDGLTGNQRKGKKLSDLLKNRPDIVCPHCGKIGRPSAGMYRWHFDNCKQK